MQFRQDYIEQLFRIFPLDNEDFKELRIATSFKEVASGATLLSSGEIATKLFIVINGCLRLHFIKDDGTDVTSQFFVENQMVASFESALNETPSTEYIEAIEDSIVGSIQLKVFKKILHRSPLMQELYRKFLEKRLAYYIGHYSSYILDKPEKRYLKLLKNSPELVARLPKQYIASYLGITPVSLSRIRGRLKRDPASINK